MVTSKATTVDEFFATLPEDRLVAMTKIRELCQQILTGFTESMDYGMPTYKRGEVVEVAFNSQKNFISVYVCRQDVMQAKETLLYGYDCGKGCIRFKKLQPNDYVMLRKLFSAVRQAKPQTGKCG